MAQLNVFLFFFDKKRNKSRENERFSPLCQMDGLAAKDG